MIFDRREHVSFYRPLHPLLSQAFDFLLQTDLNTLAPGKHVLEGEKLFALVNDYTTQPLATCRFESHRRYTDIQWMVRGSERIGVTNVGGLKVTEPYATERDIAFYQASGDLFTLSPGSFAIFFPHDAHQPGVAIGEPEAVRKVVMKVELGIIP